MKVKLILLFATLFSYNLIKAQRPVIARNSNLNTCDKKYILEMQRILDSLGNNIGRRNRELAEQYMLMVKQYTDLEIRISELENNYFDIATKDLLRRPILIYDRCRNVVTGRIR